MKIPDEVLRLSVAMGKPIEYLELSKPSYNALRRWGIDTVADLYAYFDSGKIRDVRNVGQKAEMEIRHKLENYLKPFCYKGEEHERI